MSIYRIGDAELQVTPPVGGILRTDLKNVTVAYGCSCTFRQMLFSPFHPHRCKKTSIVVFGDLVPKPKVISSGEENVES